MDRKKVNLVVLLSAYLFPWFVFLVIGLLIDRERNLINGNSEELARILLLGYVVILFAVGFFRSLIDVLIHSLGIGASLFAMTVIAKIVKDKGAIYGAFWDDAHMIALFFIVFVSLSILIGLLLSRLMQIITKKRYSFNELDNRINMLDTRMKKIIKIFIYSVFSLFFIFGFIYFSKEMNFDVVAKVKKSVQLILKEQGYRYLYREIKVADSPSQVTKARLYSPWFSSITLVFTNVIVLGQGERQLQVGNFPTLKTFFGSVGNIDSIRVSSANIIKEIVISKPSLVQVGDLTLLVYLIRFDDSGNMRSVKISGSSSFTSPYGVFQINEKDEIFLSENKKHPVEKVLFYEKKILNKSETLDLPPVNGVVFWKDGASGVVYNEPTKVYLENGRFILKGDQLFSRFGRPFVLNLVPDVEQVAYVRSREISFDRRAYSRERDWQGDWAYKTRMLFQTQTEFFENGQIKSCRPLQQIETANGPIFADWVEFHPNGFPNVVHSYAERDVPTPSGVLPLLGFTYWHAYDYTEQSVIPGKASFYTNGVMATMELASFVMIGDLPCPEGGILTWDQNGLYTGIKQNVYFASKDDQHYGYPVSAGLEGAVRILQSNVIVKVKGRKYTVSQYIRYQDDQTNVRATIFPFAQEIHTAFGDFKVWDKVVFSDRGDVLSFTPEKSIRMKLFFGEISTSQAVSFYSLEQPEMIVSDSPVTLKTRLGLVDAEGEIRFYPNNVFQNLSFHGVNEIRTHVGNFLLVGNVAYHENGNIKECSLASPCEVKVPGQLKPIKVMGDLSFHPNFLANKIVLDGEQEIRTKQGVFTLKGEIVFSEKGFPLRFTLAKKAIIRLLGQQVEFPADTLFDFFPSGKPSLISMPDFQQMDLQGVKFLVRKIGFTSEDESEYWAWISEKPEPEIFKSNYDFLPDYYCLRFGKDGILSEGILNREMNACLGIEYYMEDPMENYWENSGGGGWVVNKYEQDWSEVDYGR